MTERPSDDGPGHRPSLRGRLLALLLAGVAAAWLAAAATSFLDARKEINKLLDAHLAQSASLLVAQADLEMEEIDTDQLAAMPHYSLKVAFQIWERGGVLRLRSAGAPAERLSKVERGFSDVKVEGKSWRVFSAWDSRRQHLVQVAEERELRDEIAMEIAEHLLSPLAIALPALGIFLWIAVTRAVRPVKRLGEEVARRAPDNLSPLVSRDAPSEVAPLLDNLNYLFARVSRLMESERRFTADAAHELRTPLAAVKAQAQVARASVEDAERQHALDNVIAGCDRATRLVEQLLTLARLEPAEFQAVREPCDLAGIAREVVAALAPFALAKGVEIELDAPAPVVVSGTPELLRVLVRNLVDNAARYSPPRARIEVQVAAEGERIVLAVEDSGPGLPDADLARLGQRFFRVAGNEAGGSGLGWSIVRRIADLHGAQVAVRRSAALGGLAVRISLPAAPPAVSEGRGRP